MFKFSLSHSILLKLINFYPVSSYLRIEPFRRDIQVDYEGGGGFPHSFLLLLTYNLPFVPVGFKTRLKSKQTTIWCSWIRFLSQAIGKLLLFFYVLLVTVEYW